MKKKYILIAIIVVAGIIVCGVDIYNCHSTIKNNEKEINRLKSVISQQEDVYYKLRESSEAERQDLENQINELKDTVEEKNKMIEEQQKTIDRNISIKKSTVSEPVGKKIQTNDKDFLAKLLYCEAGGMSWKAQVYTCSAILNLSDYKGKSVWELGHNKNTFSVAPYVDKAKPKKMQYEVIDYVLNGGRIPEICYFRENKYHNFGTPVCRVDTHYFSKP